jgi:hypothetical protein
MGVMQTLSSGRREDLEEAMDVAAVTTDSGLPVRAMSG